MEWQDNPYFLLWLSTAFVSAIFVLIAWSRRSAPGAVPLGLLALAAGVWQFGYAFELMGDDQDIKVLWAKLQYPGIAVIPTAWLAVALQYTGRGHWLTRRVLVLLAVMPLTTIILAWTNESHGLIWSDISVKSNNSLLFLILDHGAWFWIFTAYSYLLMLLGIALVFDAVFHSSRHYWAQGTALAVAALAPWMTNWAFAVGLNPVTHLDLTPAAFAVSGLVLVWALI